MLRHKVDFGDLLAVDRSQEVRNVLPRFKPPVPVEFTRDSVLSKVVAQIRAHSSVELCAAAGAGKSTKVPLELSKAMGALVVHTIPFKIAAQALATYLGKGDDGDRVVFMNDLESDMPQHGVVIMTNAFFQARWAHDRFAGVQDAVLYMDETHESDAFTATLRKFACTLRCFQSVVVATATTGPGKNMKPRLPGERVEGRYPACEPKAWTADQHGNYPWTIRNIHENIMICMDRAATRDSLARAYEGEGFVVRDCVDCDFEYYAETLRLAADTRSGIVVAFVDYKFRSSLTVENFNLIDSCEVQVPGVDATGRPTMYYREAYEFEVYQFLARAGRVTDKPVHVWRSSKPSPQKMCDLESLECDAANLLYRIAGFRPPVDLSTFDFFDGPVPIDIASALSNTQPLKLYPKESRVPWINGNVGFIEEKAKAFQYVDKVRSKGKYASCHTVLDYERSVSPPPPVPRGYEQTRVDIDGLDRFYSSRDSSPASRVQTVHSEEHDNISILAEINQKPKRVAKRVQEQKAAAAAAAAAMTAEIVPSPVDSVDSGVGAVVRTVPNFPHVAEDAIAPVAQRPVARMDSIVDKVAPIHEKVEKRAFTLPEIQSGSYYFYHGMDKAPKRSRYFLNGLDSVLRYCEQPTARLSALHMEDEEKLYAMRLLVETCNHSTAVAMGIQRLFTEVSKRPSEDWQSILDYEALVGKLEWMTSQCTEAQLRVRHCHNVMPFFMRYELDVIPPALALEQRVMIQMMEEFDKAAVKKDPDKASEYLRMLNERVIAVAPRATVSGHRRIRTIE